VLPPVQFDLPPIANIGEANTIRPDSPLGVVLPMGGVVPPVNGLVTSTANEASDLHIYLQVFLKNNISSGEDGIIGRDDGILRTLCQLLGCSSSGRNVHFFSTPNDTRLDFTGLFEQVQLVLAEEKDDDITGAMQDMNDKIRFLHNYSPEITVMYGFAFSRNEFRILQFIRNPDSDIPQSSNVWFERSLNNPYDRMLCIFAALNVGRVLKYYRDNGLLSPAHIQLGTWIARQNKKEINLHNDYVIIKSAQDEVRLAQLKEFYQVTSDANVMNLEYLYRGHGKLHQDGFEHSSAKGISSLKIYLKPKGHDVMPETPEQLKAALLCLLQCVKQLHTLGYFHTDIRWPNVISFQRSWVLIDCYDFCKVDDDERLKKTKTARSLGTVANSSWSAQDDLCQIIALVNSVEFRGQEFVMFNSVRTASEQITSGEVNVDELIKMVQQIPVKRNYDSIVS